MDLRTFDLKIVFPKGDAGSSQARRLLVAKAYEKLQTDVAALGFEPQPTTFRVLWLDSFNGVASCEGRKAAA